MTKLSRENQQRAAETLQAYLSNRAQLGCTDEAFGESPDSPDGAEAAASSIRAAFAELEREEDGNPCPAGDSVTATTPGSNAEPWITAEEWERCCWPVSAYLPDQFQHRFIGLGGHGSDSLTIAILDDGISPAATPGCPRMRVKFLSLITLGRLLGSSDRHVLERLVRRKWLHVSESQEGMMSQALDYLEHQAKASQATAIKADPWIYSALIKDMQRRHWSVSASSDSARSMADASREVTTAVREERLVHHGHAGMAHMLARSCATKDSLGLIRPRRRDASDRIDGPLALVAAMQAALKHCRGGQD